MILELADWRFDVDVSATQKHTKHNSLDHCDCGYCRNYYDALEITYPDVVAFLQSFGVNVQGPSEVMPFEPTLVLACYRVKGKILQWGREGLSVSGISVLPEAADETSFFLWVGEMPLPWLQEEDMDEVLSPANQPDFLERMAKKVLQWYPLSEILS